MTRVGTRSSTEIPASGREIVIPHLSDIRPCTAVRNLVIQSSLALLEAEGHYERYLKLIDPKQLEELRSSFAPGWTPIALAQAHYQACDDLGLSQAEIERLGQRIGDRLHETNLVHAAKRNPDADFNLWEAAHALYRTYARTYEGGSLQVVKLGPKDKLLEFKQFALSRSRYYRIAQLHGIGSAYQSFGVRMETMKIVSYNPTADELMLRFTWR